MDIKGFKGRDGTVHKYDYEALANKPEIPDAPGSGGNVDLTGYATEQYVKDYAQPKGEYLTAVPEGYAKTEDIPTKPEDIGAQPSGNYALKSAIPTKVSQLTNDSGYLTQHQDVSGKLDANKLPEAIDTALAQAKASGEFDGKDGTDGEDGHTPVRGADYWTSADQAAIIQQVIDTLGGTPVFGVVDADNNIVLSGALADGTYTIKYEDADGNVTDIGTIEVGGATYTNQIPISTDTDGSVFNGTGYKTASRISSSGGVSAVSNPSASNPAFVTGFIPCKVGDIIRLSNCFLDTDGTGSDSAYYGQDIGGLRVAIYNSSKSFLTAAAWSEYASSGLLENYTVGENGYITEFGIKNANCAFVRLCLGGDPETAIVTINEEITD